MDACASDAVEEGFVAGGGDHGEYAQHACLGVGYAEIDDGLVCGEKFEGNGDDMPAGQCEDERQNDGDDQAVEQDCSGLRALVGSVASSGHYLRAHAERRK